MALNTHKIQASDYEGKDIASLPVRPTVSASELQAAFDKLVKEVVVPKFNALIEELASVVGADSIGKTVEGMSGQSVGALVSELAAKKAPLESPGLTGTPTAPTPEAQTSTAQIATTAFVHTALQKLVLESGSADMTRAVYDPQNKGTDIFAYAEDAARHTVFAVTLLANGWGEQADGTFAQTAAAASAVVNGFSYIVAPGAESFGEYGASGVYMGEVTTNGVVTFYAAQKPEADISVNIMKIHTTESEA